MYACEWSCCLCQLLINSMSCCVDDKAAVKAFGDVGRFKDTLANRAVFEVKKK